MKKFMNRIMSLLMVPCLVSGVITPSVQLSWFGSDSAQQSEEQSLVSLSDNGTTPEDTVQEPSEPLSGINVQRNSDGWTATAVYTISLGSDLTSVQTVTLTDADGTAIPLEENDDDSYAASVTANGSYAVTVTQAQGDPITAEFTEEMLDAVCPVISITSASAEGWHQVAEYLFAASDDLSQVNTVTVQSDTGLSFTLTSGENGNYTFSVPTNGSYTATVTDMAGNEASVAFEVTCVDANAPVISEPIRSAEGWAQAVIYSFTVLETGSGLTAVTIQIADGEAETLLPDELGNYTFTVQNNTVYTITATDTAGNSAQRTVTDSQIDVAPPVISTVERETSGWAQAAKYCFTVTDTGSGIGSVQVATAQGQIVTLSPDQEGVYHYTADVNGEYTIIAQDILGNKSELTFTAEQIDTTAPQISQPERDGSEWKTEAVYHFTAMDTGSQIANVTIAPTGAAAFILTPDENGVYSYTVQANGTYTVTVTDTAGNVATVTFEESRIDRVAPVVSDIHRDKNGWTTETICTFTVTETGSGIAAVSLTVDGKATTLSPSADGQYSFIVSGNGDYEVSAVDNAGNRSVVTHSENRVDRSAPVISDIHRETAGWAQEAVYTFTVSDIGSGVADVSILLPDGSSMPVTPDNRGQYRFIASSNHSYTITATDAIGNSTEKSFLATDIDRTKPVISQLSRITESWAQKAVYRFTVQDDLSGIASVAIQTAAGTKIPVTENNGCYEFVASENTAYTVTVTDAAGNTATQTVKETLIDLTSPVLKVIGRVQSSWQQSADHVFTVEDTASGILSVKVFYNGNEIAIQTISTGSYRFTANGNGVYTIVVTDMVGNEVQQDITESFIDLAAPEISDILPQQTWDSAANTVTMTVTDDCELASVTITDAQGNVCNFVQVGSHISLTVTENGNYTVTAIDVAGNKAATTFTVDHIDTEAPTVPTLSANGTGLWVNVDVIMDAAATDTQSGVAGYWYSTDSNVYGEGNWHQMAFTEGRGSLCLTDDMDLTFYVVAVDGVGRVSAPAQIRVQIDKTPAETVTLDHVLEAGSGYLRLVNGKRLFVDKLTFSAMATDAASGIARYEYRVAGTSGFDTGWISIAAGSEGITEVFRGEEDHYTVYLRVYDVAGNCTKEYAAETCVLENTHTEDSQRNPMPGVNVEAENEPYIGAWTTDTLTITVSGSSAISGVEYYEYRVDYADPNITNIAWTTVPMVNGIAQITADQDINATFYFRAVSYAGNTSLENSVDIRIQKSAPNAATLTPDKATGTNGWYTVLPGYQVTLPAQGQYFAPVQYIISCTHNGQALADVIYDGTNAPQITADGLWSFRITAIDAAGNTATEVFSFAAYSVDTKAPTKLAVSMDGNSILSIADGDPVWRDVNILNQVQHNDFTIFKNVGVTVSASADGGDSGIAAIYYQVTAEADHYDESGNWTLLTSDGLRLTPDSKNHLYFKAIDGAGNITYFAGQSILLDTALPEASVSFTDVNCSVHGFYNGNVTVDVHVEEPVMGTERVFAGLKEIHYRVLSEGVQTQQGQLWPGSGATGTERERVLSWDGSFVVTGELNNSNHVVIEITVTDMAGNVRTFTSEEGALRIDLTAPEITGSYDRNDPIVTFQERGCFTGERVLTISVKELNFIPEESFIHVLDTDTGIEAVYTWASVGDAHTAEIPIAADGHYTVTASITDAAGNVTQQILFAEGTVAADAFVIDNTPSDMRVSYDNQDVRNGKYFDAARHLTVTITERNFDPAQIIAKVYFTAENGTEKVLELTQWHSDGNTHTATMQCDVDGIYRVEITGADALGNPANPTEYTGKAPEQWVLDTYMNAPELEYVVNGMAYNGTLVPQVTVLDTNLDSISFKLIRTRLNEIDVDVTDLLLTDDKLVYQDVTGGKTIGLDIFPLEQGMDGRYTLTVTCEDKAGNTAESTVMFYANRFGSVYAYSDYLTSLLNGYFTEITEDIVITEYNPSGVLNGSSLVQITVDGVPVSTPIYEVAGAADKAAGASGWFEYTYTISSKNFAQDGVYSVVVSSKDTAGNVPENTAEDMAIAFAVDTTAPTLPLITGLEETIVKADSVKVKLSVMDNVMLDSVTVFLNGEVLASWADINSYSAEYTVEIPAGLEQAVRIVVVDKTGNTLDTDAESFAPGYGFNRTITVSTNFFLRLYANRPLFIGVVIGISVLFLGGVILIILLVKKRKNKDNQ